MKDQPKPRTKAASDLPLPVLIEELAYLRKTFRDLVRAYEASVEAEIANVQALVGADSAGKKKLPGSRMKDMRDMLLALRSLEVKPAKGRRRDLKKVENVVEELGRIAERWE